MNEIQSFLEIQALAALTRMLRNGTLPGVPHAFQKIVHVGHSFGSAQSYALVNLYPDISDGVVLTGFSMNGSFVGLFASGGNFVLANKNQPFRFGGIDYTAAESLLNIYALTDYVAGLQIVDPVPYVNGYMTNANIDAQQYLFLLPGYFDQGLAQFGENGKQPVTQGELLTLGALTPTNNYAGPVMVFTGCKDPNRAGLFDNALTIPSQRSPILRRRLPHDRRPRHPQYPVHRFEELPQGRARQLHHLHPTEQWSRPDVPL